MMAKSPLRIWAQLPDDGSGQGIGASVLTHSGPVPVDEVIAGSARLAARLTAECLSTPAAGPLCCVFVGRAGTDDTIRGCLSAVADATGGPLVDASALQQDGAGPAFVEVSTAETIESLCGVTFVRFAVRRRDVLLLTVAHLTPSAVAALCACPVRLVVAQVAACEDFAALVAELRRSCGRAPLLAKAPQSDAARAEKVERLKIIGEFQRREQQWQAELRAVHEENTRLKQRLGA